MTKDKALRLALEALEYLATQIKPDYEHSKAITAIKAALEVKDEPWEKFCDSNCVWTDHHPDCKLAQRTWVGLTDEEIAIVEDEYIVDYRIPAGSAWNFAKDIEAKLKEKNT
jgi:hypothetical protein